MMRSDSEGREAAGCATPKTPGYRCRCGDPSCQLWREDVVCPGCDAITARLIEDPEFEGRGGDMGEGHWSICPHGLADAPPASAPEKCAHGFELASWVCPGPNAAREEHKAASAQSVSINEPHPDNDHRCGYPCEVCDNRSVPAATPEPGFPRRNQMPKWSTGERAIQDAVEVVERMGADVRLTDAVILLGKARDRVADFVDGVVALPTRTKEWWLALVDREGDFEVGAGSLPAAPTGGEAETMHPCLCGSTDVERVTEERTGAWGKNIQVTYTDTCSRCRACGERWYSLAEADASFRELWKATITAQASELAALRARVTEVEGELRTVDLTIGNVSALDRYTTRADKIACMLRTLAASNEPPVHPAALSSDRGARTDGE